MKSKPKTADEKAWCERVAKFASESVWLGKHFGNHCSDPYRFHIHHIFGAQAKRKINYRSVKIGEYAILPIPIELHDVSSNHELNITYRKNDFIRTFQTQEFLFQNMISDMEAQAIIVPPADIVEAIVYG